MLQHECQFVPFVPSKSEAKRREETSVEKNRKTQKQNYDRQRKKENSPQKKECWKHM